MQNAPEPMTIVETDFATLSSRHESAVASRAFRLAVNARAPRVILAEDDDEMRALLSTRLQKEGLSVIEVPDGLRLTRLLQALALGSKHDEPGVDLIVSDVRMPGRSGLEALAALKDSEVRIPFIMITGFGDLSTHAEALRLGAAAVFDKPFDLDDLCSAVVELVGP